MNSVCMTTYNGERFIRQQIDSIHPQLSSEDEIIVSANGIRTKKKSKQSVLYNLLWTPLLDCCMAIRRDALKYILPFPKKCIGHDLWMGCLCAYKGTLVHIEEPLHKYRMHSNNVSPTLSKSSNSIFFMIKYRLDFIYHFYKRILFYR